MSTPKFIEFCGLQFRGYSWRAIEACSDTTKFVVTVNAEFIVRAHEDPAFKALINEHVGTFDGQIPFFLAKLRNPTQRVLIEKLSGSDLIFSITKNAGETSRRVFLLGASPESNNQAVLVAQNRFNAETQGYSPPIIDGHFSVTINQEILSKIRLFRPHYLFVGLGAPKQEFWIRDHLSDLQAAGVHLVIGCGGAIDFLAGKVSRAPVWMQRLGFEGIYRLFREPKLFRVTRLFRSALVFIYIFKYWQRQR